MGWTLLSGIITSGKLFPLEVQGCGVTITTGGLFCSINFGIVRVFSVWGCILSDIGDKFTIVVTEGGRVCAGWGGFCRRLLC